MSAEFLKTFGFKEDPFASTNAADEPLIGDYFVEPPFFPAVVGDPKVPKSNVVFAPRGGGKTAQKIMIEQKSAKDGTFLCIAYDNFPTETLPRAQVAPQEFHLHNICRTLLLAILLKIQDDEIDPGAMTKFDKMLLVGLSRELLGDLNSEKFKKSLTAIKSMGDKTVDAWNRYGGVVVTLINAIAARFHFGKFRISRTNSQTKGRIYQV